LLTLLNPPHFHWDVDAFNGMRAKEMTLKLPDDEFEAHWHGPKYLGAADGSMTADDRIIVSGKPVMVMGGFSGSDPAPTLAESEHLVSEGEVSYVLIGGSTGGFGRAGPSTVGDRSEMGRGPWHQGPVVGVGWWRQRVRSDLGDGPGDVILTRGGQKDRRPAGVAVEPPASPGHLPLRRRCVRGSPG
jgi:hypothetical protein